MVAEASVKTIKEITEAPLAAPNDFLDCEICHTIWCGLTGHHGKGPATLMPLGSFDEILLSECTRHKSLVEWFHRHCNRLPKRPRAHDLKDIGIRFRRPGVLELIETVKGGRCAEFLLVKKNDVYNHPDVARILNSQWVDTSSVDKWRKRCLSSHGQNCENPTKIWRIRPAWVIDTKEKCLVPGSQCDSYIALSYRWGNAQGLRIQPDTMAELQRPGALDDPTIRSQLAPMIRHALDLTAIIGERHIWIDTLCIDYSKAAKSAEQLQLMGAIYANASLTIVVLDCDAEDGFPGLKGASRPRQLDEHVIEFGKERFILDKGHLDPSTDGQYHQRGWTYQEFTMSSRRLILSDGMLNWMCQCGVSAERFHSVVEFEKASNFDMRENMRGMPDLWSLSNILFRYNNRALTYDEDALPGIFGLLTVFSRCFSGGFLYGIPEMFFDVALSWRPRWKQSGLRRRVPSNRSDSGRLHPCNLPSWSWIAWAGDVDIGGFEAGPAHAWSQRIKETVPITTWYTCDSPTTFQKRTIRSSWLENREAYEDFEKPLPPGWTRHVISDGDSPGWGKDNNGVVLPYPDGCGKYLFTHITMGGNENENPWHWPFPVPEIQKSTKPFMPKQTPYLRCDTRRAHISAFQADQGNEAILFSEEGKEIGTLSLHNEGQLQRFHKLAAGWDAAEQVEVVAVCRTRHYSKPFDAKTRRHILPLKKWEEYTVLWVE